MIDLHATQLHRIWPGETGHAEQFRIKQNGCTTTVHGVQDDSAYPGLLAIAIYTGNASYLLLFLPRPHIFLRVLPLRLLRHLRRCQIISLNIIPPPWIYPCTGC